MSIRLRRLVPSLVSDNGSNAIILQLCPQDFPASRLYIIMTYFVSFEDTIQWYSQICYFQLPWYCYKNGNKNKTVNFFTCCTSKKKWVNISSKNWNKEVNNNNTAWSNLTIINLFIFIEISQGQRLSPSNAFIRLLTLRFKR